MGKNYISGCRSGHRLWNCPDQITARICVEYFTIGHPRLIDSDSPTVLALFTGVVATWWVGLPLGLGLAAAARIGRWPKLRARDLLRPAGKLLALMLIVAGIAGSPGVAAANAGLFQLAGPLGCNVPPDKHTAFLADAWAHSGSYLAGIVGGIVLWVNTWRRRLALASEADNSTLPKGKTKMSLALAAIVMAGLPARATDSPPDYRGRQFVGFEALSSFVERKEAGGDKIVFASPVIHADINFNEVVISWNADLHADSHLEVTAQAIYPQGPTKYYNLGVWSKDRDRGPRHSQAGQHDSDGDVSTDTLILG
ncbi:MAG TPA: hypothetical protein VL361_01770, partial [Candidatus Limnocylindrales bacterium]|nr:hypothetical protein [Candidatus Limnocylindrales bacterium]